MPCIAAVTTHRLLVGLAIGCPHLVRRLVVRQRHRRVRCDVLHTTHKHWLLRCAALAASAATRRQHRCIVRLVRVEDVGREAVGEIVGGVYLQVGHAGVDETVGGGGGYIPHLVRPLVDGAMRPHRVVAVLVARGHHRHLLGARRTRARRCGTGVAPGVRVGRRRQRRRHAGPGRARGRRRLRWGERDSRVRHGAVEPRPAVADSVTVARAARSVVHHVRHGARLRHTADRRTLDLVCNTRGHHRLWRRHLEAVWSWRHV